MLIESETAPLIGIKLKEVSEAYLDGSADADDRTHEPECSNGSGLALELRLREAGATLLIRCCRRFESLFQPPPSLLCSRSRLKSVIGRSACGREQAGRLAEATQGRGWSAETTVDPTLIRGLDTAFRVFVSGLSSV